VEQGRAAVPHIRAAGLAPAESRSFPANVPQSRTNAARRKSLMLLVAWDGIEPPTRGFSGPVPLGRTVAYCRGECPAWDSRVPQ
jgi:hypothetical protein